MVTILKVDNTEDNNDKVYAIYFEFIEKYNFSMFDRILIKTSSCNKYEYLYLFMNQEELNYFINLLLNYDITIHSKKDYTDELLSLIVNNKIDEFKSQFDSFFEMDAMITFFYNMNVTKDDVLDKANFNGFNTLTNDDYMILNHVE